jgi:membrane associated rhomboid family serine protease
MSTNSWTSTSDSFGVGGIPPTTLAVIVLCVGIYIIQNVFSWDLQLFTMCPRMVLYTHEYYRVFTSTLFHANLMHIGMNMLSTSAISTSVEKKIGTIRLFLSIWWAIILTSTLYVTITYIASSVFGYDDWMYQHAVGYSGIIFHLTVIECHLHPGLRNVFGTVQVPTYWYPWVLLVVLQFIMPNLSFLGHLVGILTGTVQCQGWLDGLLLLDETSLIELEAMDIVRPLINMRAFVAVTTTTQGVFGSTGGQSTGNSSTNVVRTLGCPSLSTACNLVVKCIHDTFETLLVCILGRGSRLNTNIHLWPRSSSSTLSSSSATSDRGFIRTHPAYQYDDARLLLDSIEEDDTTNDDVEMSANTKHPGRTNQTSVASIEREALVSRMV